MSMRLDVRFVHARAARGSGERGAIWTSASSSIRRSPISACASQAGWDIRHLPTMTIVHHADKAGFGRAWWRRTRTPGRQYRASTSAPSGAPPVRRLLFGPRDSGGCAREGAYPRACAPNGGSSGTASSRAGRPATVRCASRTGVGAARRRATCGPRTTRIVAAAGATVDGILRVRRHVPPRESAEHIPLPAGWACVRDGREAREPNRCVRLPGTRGRRRAPRGRPVSAIRRPRALLSTGRARRRRARAVGDEHIRLAPAPRRRSSACLRGGRRSPIGGDRRRRGRRGEPAGRNRRCGPRHTALAARRARRGDRRPRRPSGVTGGRTGAERRAGSDRAAARACRSRPEPHEPRRGAGGLARPHRADDVDLGGRRAVSDASRGRGDGRGDRVTICAGDRRDRRLPDTVAGRHGRRSPSSLRASHVWTTRSPTSRGARSGRRRR